FTFIFNHSAITEIYTLSLHDALPIYQLTILSKTDALDEEKWLNMLGTFVKDWFRYESHFVHGRDSLVDILKERGLLSEPVLDERRSEERFSRNAETDLVCRLLLAKNN